MEIVILLKTEPDLFSALYYVLTDMNFSIFYKNFVYLLSEYTYS